MTPPSPYDGDTSPLRGEKKRSGLGSCYLDDLRPHLVLPAGIAGDVRTNLPSWNRMKRGVFEPPDLPSSLSRKAVRSRPGRGGPARFCRHEVGVGGIDHLVVEFGESIRLLEFRLGLGTPDLAAASKFVADEHQHRRGWLRWRDCSLLRRRVRAVPKVCTSGPPSLRRPPHSPLAICDLCGLASSVSLRVRAVWMVTAGRERSPPGIHRKVINVAGM